MHNGQTAGSASAVPDCAADRHQVIRAWARLAGHYHLALADPSGASEGSAAP